MDITPGWRNSWAVTEDYLPCALKQIEDHGVNLTTVFIVPSLSSEGLYRITWKNPIQDEK